MEKTAPLRILKVDSSGRGQGSATRALTADVVHALEARHGGIDLVERDLANGVPFVDQDWIDANFTSAEERSDAQRATLAESDRLVAELQAADVVVIGAPIYNFGVPAALKAWVDMVARARLTFRYTPNGPEGLLKGKQAYVVVASGGVGVDSAVDFATPYLRQVLAFIGIDDVVVVNAERINARGEDALDDARVQIADAIHTGTSQHANVA